MSDRLLRIPAILQRGVSDVASVFDAFGIGIYCVDLDGRFTYINPAGERMLRWDRGELLGRPVHDTIHHSGPDGSPFARADCPSYDAIKSGRASQELDDLFWCQDGSALVVSHTIAPLYEDDQHIGAIVVFVDVRERRRDTELLRRRAAQQSALAELGLFALDGGSLQALLDRSIVVIKETLEVDVAQALELQADRRLRLRAGVTLRSGLVGVATVEAGRRSLAGFTVTSDEPIVVEDLRSDWRFRAPPLLLDQGIVSCLTVVIPGIGSVPWGVLGAYACSRRRFSEEDINFLQTVANTIGLAIERNDVAHKLRLRNIEIAELAEQVSRLADDRRRIMADALDAEDRTRERISQMLHDEVLQSLLSARQDLAKLQPATGSRDDSAQQAREAIVVAIHGLRNAVTALHPVTLEQGGLSIALKAIADLHAGRGGFTVSLDVESRASGIRDQLIVSLVQELLSNVAQHAQAGRVMLALRRSGKAIVLEVTDDGHGMTPERSGEALAQGHVGLASITMRVESLGGSFKLTSNPGEGVNIRAVIPIETADTSPAPPRGRQLTAQLMETASAKRGMSTPLLNPSPMG